MGCTVFGETAPFAFALPYMALVQVGTPRELMVNPVDEFVERMFGTPKREAQMLNDLLSPGEKP